MKTRSVSFLSALVLTAGLGLAADARAGSVCPGSCASASDCEAGATCFDGNCVFYDAGSGGSTATAVMSTGAGGGAGGIAGTGGGAVAPGTGGTGGGCAQDSECQAWLPRSKCVSGVCHVAPCETTADCIAPETCDATVTPGFASCVIHCAWLASWGGRGGGVATGTGGIGGSAAGGSAPAGSAGSGALGGGSRGGSGGAASGQSNGSGGSGPANGGGGAGGTNGNAWHLGDGCAVAGAPGGRSSALVFLLAGAALLFRRARPTRSRPRPR